MVMDYEIRFGYNRNDNMVPVYGCEFDESGIERAIEVFQHHADNRKMSGEDFRMEGDAMTMKLPEHIEETIEIDGFVEKLRDHARDFDPDDHAAMWIEARGKVNGVPESVIDIAKDALDIENMLCDLANSVCSADMVVMA